MTPRKAGALHWTEAKAFKTWALRADNNSDREHYLAMAQDADRDRQRAESQVITTKTKGQ